MAKKAKHPVRTTEKSLEVLEALLERESARVTELSRGLDMSKSAVHNHLSTLRENGYVVKEGDDYRLGLKFLDLGGRIRMHLPVYRVGRSKVDELAEETGELVNLLTEEDGKGVHLYQRHGGESINLDTHIGKRMHLHNISLGKAILAHLPEGRVHGIVDRHGLPRTTEHTIGSRDLLFKELEVIREQGFAVDNEERAKGLQCVAAPILGPGDEPLAAISISAPTSRVSGEYDEEFKERVQSAAIMIELEIKYVGDQ